MIFERDDEMKKKQVSLFLVVSLVFSMLFSFSTSASAAQSSYEDTDLISIWRVTTSGHIYSPVSVLTKVTIDYTVSAPTGGAAPLYNVTKREVYSQTLKGYFAVYPNAQFGPISLSIRGNDVPLTTLGSYIVDSNYQAVGYYNSSSASYSVSGGSAGVGKTGFFAGLGGFQIDNTAQVDFNW